ncbi:hypothetical protein [Sunxiuqinia sp. sy24]|uniref:hypothetical protein n=1 Tax=Sunxiuqinia sp. sy24 TaxID=3461495 RepID=UPI00404632AC
MKKFIPIAAIAMMFGFVACESEEVAFDSSSDAFVISKTVETENEVDTLYGLALHVFANKPIKSVSVTSDNDTEYTLEAFQGYSLDFYYQTPEDEFTTEKPLVGAYNFDILAESAETEKAIDNLTEDMIYPTDGIAYTFDTDKVEMTLSWTEIEGADYIVVKMYENDEDKTQIFQSPNALKGDTEEFVVKASGSGWASDFTPSLDESYTIELHAFKYEPGQSGVNMQAKAVTTEVVVWNE